MVMNKRFFLLLILSVGLCSSLFAAGEARLLRFPATNGSDIVFTYAGDLYKVSANGGDRKSVV